jgi:alkylation response protein AidB-like acyl-CoA dehydrogenase
VTVDYRDSPEEAAFRAGLRAWLERNVPTEPVDWLDVEAADGALRRWQRSLHAAGYLGLTWPVRHGGRGLSPVYDAILNEEAGRIATCPPIPIIGHIGRAIYTHGTEEQQARFLPDILSGDVRWAQGFSEPEAGSDIASLRTRAELHGDRWIVNGQKMWTSYAVVADWCLLLVRTNPDVPRHRGITCLLTSMDVPGITAQKVRLASGEGESGMLFLDDVEVPADQVLGAPGDGWRIAMTTLSQERGPANQGYLAVYGRKLRDALALAEAAGLDTDVEVRRRLADAYVRGELLRLGALESLSAEVAGEGPGPRGSVVKLLWTDAAQVVERLLVDLAGAAAVDGRDPASLATYIASRVVSVYGGTSQVQRNILATRVLGLPRGAS